MSDNLEFVVDRNLFKSNSKKNFFHDRESDSKSKRGNRLKENICKARYDKTLKRKLKKYKLRKNGDEDRDVLDMSNTLCSVLRIKSPNKLQDMSDSACERPLNYLARASKQKQRMDASACVDFGLTESKQGNHINHHLPTTKSNLENERKEKNAFQLMMDSRVTSIGQNSHGQEISFSEIEQQEQIEIKNVKSKRKLVLQKMAVAKGSLKIKDREYFQEQYIKVKMDKRAERLKNMIEKSNSSVEKTGINTTSTTVSDKCSISSVQSESSVIESQPKTLKLINIFCDPILGSKVKTKSDISNEDKKFLKKLSPSIKKKENMLSYFDKIDTRSSESHRDVLSKVNNESSIIKVKITPKNSKKGKKKKLSLIKNKYETINITEDLSQNDDNMLEKNDCKSIVEDKTEEIKESLSLICQRKRKRYEKSDAQCVQSSVNENYTEPTGYSRAKRNVKRPIKYIDDAELSSSDDEPDIFTPKKKKVLPNPKFDKHVLNISVEPHKKSSKYTKQLEVKKQLDKNIKLAPIFQKKPHMSEATKNFLYSGLPDQIKKIASKLSKKINDETNLDVFHAVVHVRQDGSVENNTIPPPLYYLLDEQDSSEDNIQHSCNDFGKLLKISNTADTSYLFAMSKCNTNVVLQNIKQSYPKFPVYRTYRSLKAKCLGEIKGSKLIDFDSSMEIESDIVIDVKNENPDHLNWSNKYRPMMSNQILGNFENIKELKKWLISWTENETSVRTIKNVESDSSDYYESDSDSRDSMKSTSNLLILSGPVGSGKTSSVYAVAAELAIKVIEVNASSKRTGKIMLQDLKEATQSHKVNRGKGSNLENSQKSQEVIKCAEPKTYSRKKCGIPKKVTEEFKNTPAAAVKDEVRNQITSQEIARTGMSLILIDDADIVFDQDEGFRFAVSQLIRCSKRPVILVTTSLTCQHLQKFVQCGKIISMKPFLPKMLGTWLDLMCLADSGCCIPGLGAQFLDYYNGDIRKTINLLQFYISTQSMLTRDENILKLHNDNYKDIVEDESSSISWKDSESLEEIQKDSKESTNLEKIVWQCFIEKRPYSMELFNVWWSLPNLLNFASEPNVDNNQFENIKNKKKSLSEMELVASVLDNFSVSDCISYKRPNNEINIYSTPWLCKEEDGLAQIENIDNVRGDYEISDDIIYSLTTTSIGQAQKILNCELKTHGSYPSLTVQRQRDRIITRHKSLTNDLNISSVLDRRALALDYWPACRTICRVEKAKTVNNSKRNNRFCHYLKSLKTLCKNDTFDNLADSLCSSDNSEQICVVTK